MRNKLRELTTRGNKWSNEVREEKLRSYARGWVNYYRYADMKSLMEQTDEWLRHRSRAVYWKQWKKVCTRYKMLRALHLPEWKVHEMANCRKGVWKGTNYPPIRLSSYIYPALMNIYPVLLRCHEYLQYDILRGGFLHSNVQNHKFMELSEKYLSKKQELITEKQYLRSNLHK